MPVQVASQRSAERDLFGMQIVETDETSYVYWPDGTVSIAQHPTDWE